MTTLLWILQALLAFAFLGAGFMKLTKTRADLVEKGMGYADDLTDGQVKTIGALEVLGAVGVIAPVATGIVPMLSGVAAAGLVLTMIGAAATHIRRGEVPMIVPNLILGGMAGFVAYSHLL